MGRLSDTHLATGFAVNHNPRKKEWWNGKAAESSELKVFEQKGLMHDSRKLVTDYLADRIRAVHGNLAWGTYHENLHESKKKRVEQLGQRLIAGTLAPRSRASSLAGNPPPGSGPLRNGAKTSNS